MYKSAYFEYLLGNRESAIKIEAKFFITFLLKRVSSGFSSELTVSVTQAFL